MTPRTGGARILLVDDDADLREELAAFIESAGYAVRQASDGDLALAALREFQPDLMITDVMMPGEDGIGLLRRRAALGLTCPVIVMTGGSQQLPGLDVLKIADMMGADAVLAKPFPPDAILAEIGRLLPRAQ